MAELLPHTRINSKFKILITPMKHLNTRTLSILMLSAFLFAMASCARKANFEKSSVVPSASGQVKVKKGGNNNYSIDLQVRDLTVPENLVPPQNVYIVWNESNNGVFNVGKLITSRNFLSRGFKASLSTKSPNKPRKVFITAERDANTLYPGSQVVLTTPEF